MNKIKNITFALFCTFNVFVAHGFTCILRIDLSQKDNFKMFNHHLWYEYNFYVVLLVASVWLAIMLLPTYYAVMTWNKNYKKAYIAALVPLAVILADNFLF